MGATRREVLQNIAVAEREGAFDRHVDPIDYEMTLPVDGNFQYIKTGMNKISCALKNNLIAKPFSFYHNNFVLHTQVRGRENMRGIKSAIVTCNHVYMFDCLAVKHAIRHKNRFVVADFNNMKGTLGSLMRAGGIMPISSDFSAMKNFNKAVEYYLKHNNYVVFYPEQAMWYMYDKPRPFKDGAFHYAVKHNVPVIPLFITYRASGKRDSEGLPVKYFTVNIMPPIYPDESLDRRENIVKLKAENYAACLAKYEEVYDKKIVFGGEKCFCT